MKRIELHIDSLVLEGFPPDAKREIAAAFEAELARLFRERGLPVSLRENRALSELAAPEIRLRTGAHPLRAGTEAARSLYGGLRS